MSSLEVHSPSKPHSLTDCLTHRGRKCYQQTVQMSTLRLGVHRPGLLSLLPLQSHRLNT